MSGTKKQDIADSWEEIDEDRLVSAITILKNSTSPGAGAGQAESPKASTTSGNTARQNTLPQMLEEELKPKMVARPMQILKRPQTSGGSEGKSAADAKPKTQIKSLDQRRLEYAEARLRILGSAHDDEEAETKKTPPATNGYRINNVNNNNTNGSSANTSTNSSASGSGGAGGGDGMTGSSGGANNNANNMYRYHQPYRQQAPIGTFPPSLQNVSPGGGRAPGQVGGAPVMYFPTPPNQLHSHHHPMQTAVHPLHHSHQAFPPLSHHHQHQHHPHHHHHHHGQQTPPSPHQHGNHPYTPQHFTAAHLNHQPVAGGRDGAWYGVGGRNGGNNPAVAASGGGGYYASKGGAGAAGGGGAGYGEGGNGQPPLLGHAPPGVMPYNGTPAGQGMYGQAAGGTPAATQGGSNIVNNQHVLRLPAGPDGSQGFSMRR